MANPASIEQVLERVRIARVAGDLDALMAEFDEHPTFRIVGFGDPSVGREAVRETLRRLIDLFDFVAYRPISTLIVGTDVVMRYGLTVRHRPSGRTADTENSDHLVFAGERCSSYIQHVDTALITRLIEG